MRHIKSFVFMDLETTGLRKDFPRITEMAMMGVRREHLIAASNNRNFLPRVCNTFNVCVDPTKPIEPKAAEITGLTNELLAGELPFDPDMFSLMCNFLGRMPGPVCLVAHNGHLYDFPLLQAEISRIGKALSEVVVCADSLAALRHLLPLGTIAVPEVFAPGRDRIEMVSSHRLEELHRFLVGRGQASPIFHSAGGDVAALAQVVASQGDAFPAWADATAVPFAQVKPMW